VNPLWFMRMAKWARRPPSMTQVKIVGAVLAIAVAIVLADKLGFWPDWARLDRAARPRLH